MGSIEEEQKLFRRMMTKKQKEMNESEKKNRGDQMKAQAREGSSGLDRKLEEKTPFQKLTAIIQQKNSTKPLKKINFMCFSVTYLFN